MKDLLLAGLAVLLSHISLAQSDQQASDHLLLPKDNSKNLAFIKEIYGEERMAADQELVNQLLQLLSERVSITYQPELTEEKCPQISTLGLHNKNNPSIAPINPQAFDPATFNPLTYNWNYFDTKFQTFLLDGTGYVLVVEPVSRKTN